MTEAPSDLLALRQSIMDKAGITDPDGVGIVGNAAHVKGYHVGVQTIKNRGNYPDKDYSTEHIRDRVGGDLASAEDVTHAWGHGGPAKSVLWANACVAALKAGQLPGLRAINYLNLQGQKRRFDTATGIDESSTDSVDIHTHFEWWRDTEGHRQQSIAMMLQLMDTVLNGQSGAPMSFVRNVTTHSIYYEGPDALIGLSGTEWGQVSPQTYTDMPQSVLDRTNAPEDFTSIVDDVVQGVVHALVTDGELPHITDDDAERISQKTADVLSQRLVATVSSGQ